MCELFGINSEAKIKCNELLREFYSHGVDNKDGWGLAIVYRGETSLEKEPILSTESVYLKNRLTDDIIENQLLAHIRKASKGHVEYKNTHPFVLRDSSGRLWTLEHNGTIFESEELAPYIHRQKGYTDSERILYYLVDRMNAGKREHKRELTGKERFETMDEFIHTITPENKVNLLIYDGDMLYIHTNQKGTLYWHHKGKTLIVSTKPLQQKQDWEEVPLNTLFAYRNGELVFKGNTHENEYMENEQKSRELYLDYAIL